MWSVSDAYKEAVVKPSRKWKAEVRVTYKNGEQAVFTDETIKDGITIYSQMVSGDEDSNTIDIGAVPEKKIELTLIDSDSDLHRYAGARLSVHISLMLANGEYEEVPMGVFFVDSSALSRIGTQIHIIGYDGMLTFQYNISDKLRNQLTWEYPTNAARLLAEQSACGFHQNLWGFPNGTMSLNFTNPQIVTGWDGIMWLAQMMGCFARINRQNDLEFVPIKFDWEYFDEKRTQGRIVETRTINESERYDGITFSDDRMHIVGVTMPGDGKYITSGGTGGLDDDANITILLEKNPVLANFEGITTDEHIAAILGEILKQLRTVYFYAFKTDIENDPALDAGDVIRLKGGIINGTNKNNDLYGFITYNTWRYQERQTITSSGQTPIIFESSETTGETTDLPSYLQPKSQSEKFMNALSIGNQQLEKKMIEINNQILYTGVGRAKYLQTDDGYPYAATALRTTHPQIYSSTGGEIGYEFTEKTNNDYSANWNAMISGKMEYRKVTGEAHTRHPIADIYYNWNIKPAKAIDGPTPDGINFFMAGHSEGVAFSASAELSCDGLWVSDGLPGTVPYDKVQMFSARYIHSYTEHIQEFVIANVIFTIMDDGIYITQPATSFGFGGKEAVIPWRSSGDTSDAEQSTQSEVQKAQTMSVKSVDSGSEPSYTYDDDGIHISYNGHTKVIPWDT